LRQLTHKQRECVLNKLVGVTFNANEAGTINATTYTLKQGTTAVAGCIHSGTTAVFTPTLPLAANSVYMFQQL
jgi:hypothetical protein